MDSGWIIILLMLAVVSALGAIALLCPGTHYISGAGKSGSRKQNRHKGMLFIAGSAVCVTATIVTFGWYIEAVLTR